MHGQPVQDEPSFSPSSDATATPRDRAGCRAAECQIWFRRAALYPQAYLWYVLLSAIDLVFTRLILHVGGREVNAVANWIIRTHDVAGVVIFKFMLVALVLLICEVIGRRDHQRGLKLARWAVAISLFPVLVGAFQLLSL